MNLTRREAIEILKSLQITDKVFYSHLSDVEKQVVNKRNLALTMAISDLTINMLVDEEVI